MRFSEIPYGLYELECTHIDTYIQPFIEERGLVNFWLWAFVMTVIKQANMISSGNNYVLHVYIIYNRNFNTCLTNKIL